MTNIRADLAGFILAALCVVAIAILAGLGVPIPEVLSTVAMFAVGGGVGAALPRSAATPPASTPLPAAGTGVIP